MAFADQNDSGWLSQLPTLAATAPPPTQTEQPGFFKSALGTGFGGVVKGINETIQAGGAALNLPGVEQYGREAAARNTANIAPLQRPDLEALPWYSPKGIAYKTLQSLPLLGGAAATAFALGPAEVGAAAPSLLTRAIHGGVAMLPSAIGENVETSQAESPGQLTQSEGLKALALGVPEALAQGVVPGSIEATVAGSLAKRALVGGAKLGLYQGAQSGVIQGVTDAAYHPEMSSVDRAKNVVDAALSGGIQGAIFGGAISAFRPQHLPPGGAGMDNDALAAEVDKGIPTNTTGQNLSNMQLPAPPAAQITDQRPVVVNVAGEASRDAALVTPDNPGVKQLLGPDNVLALPTRAESAASSVIPEPTGPLNQIPSEELQGLHAAYGGLDKMDSAQAGLANQVRTELTQRTVPGLKPGEGNLFTPEEAAARKPQVDAMKASLNLPEKAQDTPFFKNLNATTEPELINAIDAELKTHDRVSKADATEDNLARKATKVPEWLKDLANDKGLMDGNEPSSPSQKLEDLGIDKVQAQKVLDAATPVGGAQLREANRKMADINAQIDTFTSLDQVHQEAAQQLADAKVPKDPTTGTPIAQPDLTVKARPAPTGLDAAAQAKWNAADAIVRGNTSDDFKNQALAHQAAIEAGGTKAVTKEALTKLDRASKAEAKGYTGDDRSIKEADSAVQEPSTTGVDAREPSGDGGGVGAGDTQGAAAAARPEDIEAARADQANRDKSASAAETPKKARKTLGVPVSDRKQLELLHASEPVGSPRRAFIEKALASADPVEHRIALNTLRLDREIGSKESLRAPDWARAAAAAGRGEVIHMQPDGQHAVTRSFDAWGDPQYEMRSQTGVLPDDKTTQALKDAITQDKLQDKHEFQKNPEGPWKDKTGSVVGSAHVPSENVGLVAGWLRQVGLGDVKVALINPEDARGEAATREGLNGPYQAGRRVGVTDGIGSMNSFGPQRNEFYMHTDSTLSPGQTVDTLGHETGHVVERTALLNAPAETKRAINDAHAKYFAEQNKLPLQEAIKLTRLRSGRINTDAMPPEQQAAFRNYATSFSEWFADNVSRELTSAKEPLGVVGKFFYNVAQKIKQLMQVFTGNQFLPDSAVAKFMQELRDTARTNPDMFANDITRGREGARVPEGTPEQLKARTPEEANDRLKVMTKNLESSWQKVSDSWTGLPTKLRRATLIAQSFTGLVNNAGKYLTSAKPYHTAHELREARASMKNKADAVSGRAYLAAKPEQKNLVNSLWAKIQNPWDLDPEKNIKYYADKIVLASDPARLRAFHQEMVSDLDRIRSAGLYEIYKSLPRMFQTKGLQTNVAHMHAVAESWADRGVHIFGKDWANPDETYRTLTTLHDDPLATQKFYHDMHDGMQERLSDYLSRVKDEATKFLAPVGSSESAKRTGKAQFTAMMDGVSDLTNLLNDVTDRKAQVDKGTYMPLSREDHDHFVSARFAKGVDGLVASKTQYALEDAMRKAGFDVGMSYDPSSSTIMVKVKDIASMDRLHGVFQEMQKAGHLEADSVAAGHPDDLATMHGLGTPFIQQMIASMKTNIDRAVAGGLDPIAGERLKKQVIAQFMDTVSDRSTLPNMQQRDFVTGYDPEMGKAAIMKAMNSSRATTAVSSRPEMSRASEAMRAEIMAQKKSDMTPAQREIGQDVARELMRREAEAAWHIPHSFVDTIKSGMHTLMVGANPAYTLTAFSQVPTLLHGELAKKYGYAKSGLAIAKATGPAFKMMRSVFNSPDGAAVGFREDALVKGGNARKNINTVMRLENAGKMTSFTQAMSELGEGASPQMQKIRNWANALGVYAEQLPRVIAAIAAGNLHDERFGENHPARDQYVSDVVSNSQFNWGPGETSRLTSKRGPLGQVTQISLAFMQYQTNMVQKLYQEVHAVLGKDGPQAQKEAGMFLATHMIAVTAIAGTLGLPGASIVAGAFDKIYSALTGKDDMDIQGLYRTYMAHTFGADVADVIAKGLPRALGVDLSKLGDQNLIPGTGFMTDKRKWEDAEKDWLKSMAGAGGTEAGNLVLGGRDLMNGDFLQAAIKFAPEGLKGIAEGAFYGRDGYVDKNGIKLPIGSPSAMDIVYATLGFDPSRLAQYQEAKRISSGLEAQKTFREQQISQHLVKAEMTGDSTMLKSWINAAVEFQQDHPGEPGPLMGMGRDLQQHMMSAIQAKALGVPLGVKPLDFGIRRAAGFLSTGQ